MTALFFFTAVSKNVYTFHSLKAERLVCVYTLLLLACHHTGKEVWRQGARVLLLFPGNINIILFIKIISWKANIKRQVL